jgi:uncharacterized protein YuzE
MTSIHIAVDYDSEGDILYITFGKPRAATGYQLSDQLLLRLDKKTDTVAGITIFNFAYHTQAEREFKIPNVDSRMLSILTSAPVNQFVTVQPGKVGLTAQLCKRSFQDAVFAMSGG